MGTRIEKRGSRLEEGCCTLNGCLVYITAEIGGRKEIMTKRLITGEDAIKEIIKAIDSLMTSRT